MQTLRWYSKNISYDCSSFAIELLASVGMRINQVLHISSKYYDYNWDFQILWITKAYVSKWERITASKTATGTTKIHIIIWKNTHSQTVKFLWRVEDLLEDRSHNERYPFDINTK